MSLFFMIPSNHFCSDAKQQMEIMLGWTNSLWGITCSLVSFTSTIWFNYFKILVNLSFSPQLIDVSSPLIFLLLPLTIIRIISNLSMKYSIKDYESSRTLVIIFLELTNILLFRKSIKYSSYCNGRSRTENALFTGQTIVGKYI